MKKLLALTTMAILALLTIGCKTVHGLAGYHTTRPEVMHILI